MKNNNAMGWLVFLLSFSGVNFLGMNLAYADTSANSYSEAIAGGKPLIQFRTRYEHVEQDGKLKDADAWTLRSLVGWQTLPFHDLSVTAQLINVTHLSNNFYDNDHGAGLPSPYTPVFS